MRRAERMELEGMSYWRTIGNSQYLVTRVISMGRRNTKLEPA
jgi:hypothetical protein